MKKIIVAVVIASFAGISFNAAAAGAGTAPSTQKHAVKAHHTHKASHAKHKKAA